MVTVMRTTIHSVLNLPVKLCMFFHSTHCCHLTDRPRCVQVAEHYFSDDSVKCLALIGFQPGTIPIEGNFRISGGIGTTDWQT